MNGSLSHAIRGARIARGLTQAELAARIGVSQGTISFWENGVETPNLEHVIALALELPEIVESFAGRERELLERVVRLERELFAGRCACKDCTCSTERDRREEPHREKGHSMKIAITGKGGVGKTTIAGTLARLLAEDDRRVLAIDADSNPNLAISLGIPRGRTERVTAVPPGLTEWREDAEGHAYVHLRQPVRRLIDEYGAEAPDGVRLLVMGEVLEASVGCRCEAHAVARGITGHLLSEADVVVLDMEAGLEHLGRGTTEHVDVLLVVVEPYYRALEAGRRIRDLAAELGLPRILGVANRVRTPQEREAIERFFQAHDLELVATIPYDEAILAAEQQDRAPLDFAPHSPAMEATRGLAAALRASTA